MLMHKNQKHLSGTKHQRVQTQRPWPRPLLTCAADNPRHPQRAVSTTFFMAINTCNCSAKPFFAYLQLLFSNNDNEYHLQRCAEWYRSTM